MRWYSVKNKLPKENTEVIIMLQNGNVTNAHYELITKNGEWMSIKWLHFDPEKVQYGINYYPVLLPYDTDNDGWIQASDALLVLQYAVGKIDSFPRKSAEPSISPVFNTPSEVVLYKNGKEYSITDTQAIKNIIDVLNFWFNLYTFPLNLDTHYDNFNDFISDIKADQTAVELRYGTEAVSDASSFSSYNRILIPTTGEYKNTVFLGDNEKYFNTRVYSYYQTDTRFISIVNSLSVE